jgi:hypothetical protein
LINHYLDIAITQILVIKFSLYKGAKTLRVLNTGNGLTFGGCPIQTRKQFFETYKNEFEKIDMVS